ncbi:MAG: peptidoglycan-binding protein [Candidatus Xenobiia bacterium LiM19]
MARVRKVAVMSINVNSQAGFTPAGSQIAQQRQQARETQLAESGPQQVEGLDQKQAQELNGFYNKVTEHIDQLRYPPAIQALSKESYVKDGSDPQMLEAIRMVLDNAPELQGTELAAHVQSGQVERNDIQALQRFLESKGYSVGSTGVDGLYGPRTDHALRGFLSGAPPESQISKSGSAGQAAPASQGSNTSSGSAGIQGNSAQQASNITGQTGSGSPAPAAATTGQAGSGSPAPAATGQAGSGQTTGAPPGYQPIRGQVPSGVSAKARSLLGGDFGTETPFELDGKKYVARVEHHYHPPGYVGGPTGWHKGVTVYEQKS